MATSLSAGQFGIEPYAEETVWSLRLGRQLQLYFWITALEFRKVDPTLMMLPKKDRDSQAVVLMEFGAPMLIY